MTHPTAKLGDVAEFIRGITFKPADVVPVGEHDSVVCMRTKNVQALLDCDDLLAVPSQFVRRKDQYLYEGDILVSSANSWNLVGKCCWVPALPWRAAFGGFISVLRGDATRVDRRYLYWWFASERVQALLRSFGQKTTNISNLNIERCLQLALPLPEIAEQRRIAAILDKADALRTKRREALAQLDHLAQATFLEMFGDAVKSGWPVMSVEAVAANSDGAIRTGPFGSQLLHSEFVDEGIAVLGIDNAVANQFRWGERRFITEAKFRTLRRYTVKPGDVLITIMGTCGRCAVVPDDIPRAINTKHLCCITLDRGKCLPAFLHSFFLWHPMARQYLAQTSKGAIMDGLNMGIIKAMPIVTPPVPLQERFAARMDAIAECKSVHADAIAQAEALFTSVQHRAFLGEL